MAKENEDSKETMSMDMFSMDEGVFNDMQEFIDDSETLLDEEDSEEKKEIKSEIADPIKKEENVGKDKIKDAPAKPEEIKTSSSVNASKLYSSFAKSLKDSGAFQDLELSDDEEIDSVDKLNAKIEELVQKRVDNSLDELQKEFKEATKAGMPVDEFKDLQNKISQIDNITDDFIEDDSEDSINLRFNAIKNNHILQGIKEEKADKLAKLALKEGNDIEEAKEALAEIKEYYKDLYKEKKDSYDKETKKKQEDENNSIKTFEDKINKTEEIAGFKIDSTLKKKIFENTTKVVGKHEGRPLNSIMKDRLSNPEEFDLKLNFLHVVTKGFKDFSYFTNKGKKQAVNEFDKLLQSTGGDFEFGTNNKSFSFLDDIDVNEKVF